MNQRVGLDQEVVFSRKMEELGRLAAGITHEFNNLLMALTAHADLLLEQLAAGDPGRASAEEVRRVAQRGVGLVRQIASFSRKRPPVPQDLDLNLVVGDLVRMLRRLIGENIALDAVLEPELGAIHADLGQIEHAVMSLAVAARDAMPRGGRLTLVTAQVDDAERLGSGRWAMLSVGDGGATEAPRCLSVVEEIVAENGGRLEVDGGNPGGSTVRLFFPVVGEPAPAVTGSGPAPDASGTETILIIEDEDAVRKVLAESFQRLGYAVLEAGDGDEALGLAEGQAIPIQAVITDLVLPGIPALEIARRIKPLHPEARFVFISGYQRPGALRQLDGDPEVVFLEKPFSVADLAGTLRRLLDA